MMRIGLIVLLGAAATLSGAAAFVVLGILVLDAAWSALRRRGFPCRPPAATAGAAANAVWTLLAQEYAWDLTGRRVTMVQGSAPTDAWILGLAALTALAFAVALPRSRGRLLAAAVLPPLLLAVALSQTRSAWLGLAAGLVVVAGASRRRGAAVVLAGVLAAAVFGPSALRERAAAVWDPGDSAVSVRVKQWRVGLELTAWRPVTGVGDVYLSDLARIRTGYIDRLDGEMHHLHHSLLTAAVFWGVPGAVFHLVLMGTLLWRLVQAWRAPPAADPTLRAWTWPGWGRGPSTSRRAGPMPCWWTRRPRCCSCSSWARASFLGPLA